MELLFKNKTLEVNPTVLIRKDHPEKNDFSFLHRKLVGVFFRVIPQTAREIFFIQNLAKNYVVFVPESGDGLVLSPSCLKGMHR